MNVYMARQPIFDTENHVYGYELLYRSNGVQNQYNGVDGDASTADVITNAFFGLDIRDIIGKQQGIHQFHWKSAETRGPEDDISGACGGRGS